MSFRKKWRVLLIPTIIFLSFFLNESSFGQKNLQKEVDPIKKKFGIKQDTTAGNKKRNIIQAEPDTNFTWEKYVRFLKKISDTSKYVVLPLNEFRQTFNSKKVVIGLRHDVDIDLNVAYKFSQIESNLGFRSTYFILHTAPYYLVNPNNFGVHTDEIIPILKSMQNERHFEIGWHNDLVTLQVMYNINPVIFLHSELNWLRTNGINIYGTAAHGSTYCKTYHYMNFYFFEECTYPIVPNRENNITVPKDGKVFTLIKGKLSDFDLKYEAYFLNNNKAFSDATITNGIRWNIDMLDLGQLQPGDRAIILLHPIHWHKGSVFNNFESFNIPGQKSCTIDTINSTISVEMPYGTNKRYLTPVFSLSPGAYAKVSGKMQFSRNSPNDFTNPLIYKVYAENRDVQRDWIINVHVAKNSACDFLSFTIPGVTKSTVINPSKKTILLEVDKSADLKHLQPQFEISPGASAWIYNAEQISNSGKIDFSRNVLYRILAEDGVSSCTWTVTVQKLKNLANFLSFSIPGQIGQSNIDTAGNTVTAEISGGHRKDSLRPSFVLSENSHAWISKQEQLSDISVIDFSNPVFYDIISKDSQIIKKWTVNVLDASEVVNEKPVQTGLLIYPNPSDGKTYIHFTGVKSTPTTVEIFNTMGEKVHSEKIKKTGDFTIEEDLKKLQGGVYIVRFSETEKPGIIVIKKH